MQNMQMDRNAENIGAVHTHTHTQGSKRGYSILRCKQDDYSTI